jgi:hypothetical protein
MDEFTELNEADLGTVVGGTDWLIPRSYSLGQTTDAIMPS